MAVRLTILEPDQPERSLTYSAETNVTIGRSSQCTIRIEGDPLISRLHALLHMAPPLVKIKDLGSRNGLIINGMRFDGVVNQRLIKPKALRNGDTVIMGKTALLIAITDDGKATPPSRASGQTPHGESSDSTRISSPSAEDAIDTASFMPTL